MVPFFVLLAAFAVFRGPGFAGASRFDSWQGALRPALAIMLLPAASAHWGRRRADLVRLVPPRVSEPGIASYTVITVDLDGRRKALRFLGVLRRTGALGRESRSSMLSGTGISGHLTEDR